MAYLGYNRLEKNKLGANSLGHNSLGYNRLGTNSLGGLGGAGLEDLVWTKNGLSTRQRERELQAQHMRELAQRRRDELTLTDVQRIADRYGITIDVGFVDRYGFVDDIWSEDDPQVGEWLNAIIAASVEAKKRGESDWGKRQALQALRSNLPKRGSPSEEQITKLADELGLEVYYDDDENMYTNDYDFNRLILGVIYEWNDEEFRHLRWSEQKKYIKECYQWLNYNPETEAIKLMLMRTVAGQIGISPTLSDKTGNPIGDYRKYQNAFNDAWDAYYQKDMFPSYTDMYNEMLSWKAMLQNDKETRKQAAIAKRKQTRKQNQYYENLSMFGKFKHKMAVANGYDIHGVYHIEDSRAWWDGDNFYYGKY